MIFTETPLSGAFIIELELSKDERGFFARSYCQREFAAHGIRFQPVQCNISYNEKRGTLRGLHYQSAPREEAKLIRCTRGAIRDVIIDLRSGSATFARHFAVDLTEQNHVMLYVPQGFAHGFQSVKDGTEVFYLMSEFYVPELSRGMRWNDPAFGINWPIENPTLSARDRAYPDFVPSKS